MPWNGSSISSDFPSLPCQNISAFGWKRIPKTEFRFCGSRPYLHERLSAGMGSETLRFIARRSPSSQALPIGFGFFCTWRYTQRSCSSPQGNAAPGELSAHPVKRPQRWCGYLCTTLPWNKPPESEGCQRDDCLTYSSCTASKQSRVVGEAIAKSCTETRPRSHTPEQKLPPATTRTRFFAKEFLRKMKHELVPLVSSTPLHPT